jgi:hypothetical protein
MKANTVGTRRIMFPARGMVVFVIAHTHHVRDLRSDRSNRMEEPTNKQKQRFREEIADKPKCTRRGQEIPFPKIPDGACVRDVTNMLYGKHKEKRITGRLQRKQRGVQTKTKSMAPFVYQKRKSKDQETDAKDEKKDRK